MKKNWMKLIKQAFRQGESVTASGEKVDTEMQEQAREAAKAGRIEFASDDKVVANEALVRSVMLKVFDLDYDGGFYSDWTELSDLCAMEEDEAMKKRIKQLYKIDLPSLHIPLLDLIEKIKAVN